MKTTPFATILVVTAATLAGSATSVFARDDGPRLAQDRLDALVAQHREANRHIAQAPSQEKSAQLKKKQGAS